MKWPSSLPSAADLIKHGKWKQKENTWPPSRKVHLGYKIFQRLILWRNNSIDLNVVSQLTSSDGAPGEGGGERGRFLGVEDTARRVQKDEGWKEEIGGRTWCSRVQLEERKKERENKLEYIKRKERRSRRRKNRDNTCSALALFRYWESVYSVWLKELCFL